MPAFDARLFVRWFYLVLAALLLSTLFFEVVPAVAQSELATVFGRVTDPSGAVISGALVELRNVSTNAAMTVATNSNGLYSIPSLHPGEYIISVRKPGFRTVSATGLELNVQDNVARNFVLQVGSAAESVTVTAEGGDVNTTDASVSTVVDRQFAENLPMNGRSFQTLIELTPGVVVTPSSYADPGQFSINGQRTDANYWTVDGVSANVGVGINVLGLPSQGASGSLPAFGVQGGTSSLVSVDALQEFRIQTSTYAPEFGRTPGGQISIVTRAGANRFHGSVFDYFRNDALDANDWFADRAHLPKPQERQNDFGRTFSGPIVKDRTFFFFSYEGLRLRLPQTAQDTVPDLMARQTAITGVQPYLNAFPLPNGPEVMDSSGQPIGAAMFNATYSDRSSLDAYSLRVDHRFSDKINVFGRYNYARTSLLQRGFDNAPLSTVAPIRITTQTGTAGMTWLFSPNKVNDLRFNYSRVSAEGSFYLDSFGGAVPLNTTPFPSPFTVTNSGLFFQIRSLIGRTLQDGFNVRNLQRQINVVDTASLQVGQHALKVGVDFRRLTPTFEPTRYFQDVNFSNMSSAEAGNLNFSFITSNVPTPMLFHNLSAFAQDTWRAFPHLTLTYGLRWDVDFAPTTTSGPAFPAAVNFDNPAKVDFATAGTPAFKTPYGNVAPRLGVAYQLSQKSDWGTVLRGGFGVFYDLATQQAGTFFNNTYPFGNNVFTSGGAFPLDAATAAAPPITAPSSSSPQQLIAFNPHLQLPYTLQWSTTVEQEIGRLQSLSASYIGSVGRRLILSEELFSGLSSDLNVAQLTTNAGTSDYNALQLKFQRRLKRGLQVLTSYTWGHSIDTGSSDSFTNPNSTISPGVLSRINRASSDFDIRQAFSAGITYKIPPPGFSGVAGHLVRDWSVESTIQVRSAPPVNVFDSVFFDIANAFVNVRPDVVPGIPLYLHGPTYPGGKAFDNVIGAAQAGCPDGSQSIGPFCPPPIDPNTGAPIRQGTLGRNALRSFGATQWDLAVHRDFPIRESLSLQFRAELFNALNHPNFGPPSGDISDPTFGASTQMLGRSLGGGFGFSNVGGGGFSPLYQLGGPRSIQMALKLVF